jgi:hypothetical protein
MKDYKVWIAMTFIMLLILAADSLPTWLLFIIFLVIGIPLLVGASKQGIDTTPGRGVEKIDRRTERTKQLQSRR